MFRDFSQNTEFLCSHYLQEWRRIDWCRLSLTKRNGIFRFFEEFTFGQKSNAWSCPRWFLNRVFAKFQPRFANFIIDWDTGSRDIKRSSAHSISHGTLERQFLVASSTTVINNNGLSADL